MLCCDWSHSHSVFVGWYVRERFGKKKLWVGRLIGYFVGKSASGTMSAPKEHKYWDDLDYDALAADADVDGEGAGYLLQGVQKAVSGGDTKARKTEMERLKKEASRKERAAKVAALKSRKLGPKDKLLKKDEQAKEMERREKQAQEHEKLANTATEMSKQFETFMDERKKGSTLIQTGNYEKAVERLRASLLGIESFIEKLPKEMTDSQPQDSGEHSHGHGHHGGHGHSHTGGECEHGHTKSTFKSLAAEARTEVLLLLGRCYMSQKAWVNAVDAFRSILLEDRDSSFAWILRGAAFLEMGCPLLAELHLSQPQVKSESVYVKKLIASVHDEVIKRQERTLEDNVIVTTKSVADPKSVADLTKCKEEGDRLRIEGFYDSASLKYLAVLELLGHWSLSSDEIDSLTVSCMLSVAACCILRGSDYSKAARYCTLTLRGQNKYGIENPKALFYRAQAERGLGQYALALEDFQSARRACTILRMAYSGDDNLKSQIPCVDAFFGLPNVVFFRQGKDTLAQLRKLTNHIEKEIKSTRRAWRQLGQVTYPANRVHFATCSRTSIRYPLSSLFFSTSKINDDDENQRQPGGGDKRNILLVINSAPTSEAGLLDIFPAECTVSVCNHHTTFVGDSERSENSILEGFPFHCAGETFLEILNAQGYSTKVFHVENETIATDVFAHFDLQDTPSLTALVLKADVNVSDFIATFNKLNPGGIVSFTSTKSAEDGKVPWLISSPGQFQIPITEILRCGETVECLSPTCNEWFAGMITSVSHDTQLLSVTYLDGDQEQNISFSRVRSRRQKSQTNDQREDIISNHMDILPTLFQLSSGTKLEGLKVSRDFSGMLLGKESGRRLFERGNFALIVPDIAKNEFLKIQPGHDPIIAPMDTTVARLG
mmetsp:Transcript_8017/g.17609  ORF Transcript_8017/g.17609 Transcript_8017/m.17609 type:complete len:889 (-) Transcript_8017:1490-4156(-)